MPSELLAEDVDGFKLAQGAAEEIELVAERGFLRHGLGDGELGAIGVVAVGAGEVAVVFR